MEFVAGMSTLESVAKFLEEEAEEIALAVAFWGGDAFQRLKIADWRAKNVRIICDAESGACNPSTLRKMMDRFGPRFRTNPRLHAKVYWTPRKMLVTSANASASGLCLQADEVKGNIEAGIVITESETIKQTREWFDGIYDHKDTSEIDDAILKTATRRWHFGRERRFYGSSHEIITVTEALSPRRSSFEIVTEERSLGTVTPYLPQ